MFKEVSSAWGLLRERGQAFHDEGLGPLQPRGSIHYISRREAKEEPREGVLSGISLADVAAAHESHLRSSL